MTGKFIKVIVVPALILAVLIVAAALALSSDWAKNKALAYISDTIGRQVTINDTDLEFSWPPFVRLEGVQLADADWSDTPTMVEIEALEASVDLSALMSGDIVVPRLRLTKPQVSLEVSKAGEANWRFAGGEPVSADDDSATSDEHAPADDGSPASIPVVRELLITDARIRYVDHADDRRVVLRLDRVEGGLAKQYTRLDAHGTLDGEALDLAVDTGPIQALGRDGKSFPLSLELNAKNLSVTVDGQAQALIPPRGMDLRVDVEGNGVPPVVDAVLRMDPSGLPGYRLQAQFQQPGPQRWRLQDLSANVGKTELQGEAELDLSGDKPSVTADLVAPTLHVDQLRTIVDQLGGQRRPEDDKTPFDLAALRAIDAHLAVEVEDVVATQAPITGGSVTAELQDGRLEIDSSVSDQTGNSLALDGHLDASKPPATGALALDFGQFNVSRNLAVLGVDQAPPGTLSGQVAVAITKRPLTDARSLVLPWLGEIELQPSNLRYVAPELDTDVKASARGRGGDERLEISADGRIRDTAFTLTFEGDSPGALRDPDRPYALDLSAELGETTLGVAGEIEQALIARGFNLEVSIEGPNPARLTPILDFPLPELPPYSVQASLNRDGDTLELANLNGRVGDSDVSGEVRVEVRDGPPSVYATLRSQNLDFDDLGGLIGASPAAGPEETATKRQRREDRREEQDQRILPSERLNLQRVARAMDGVIDYRGEQVHAAGLPLDDLWLNVEIGDGRLSIDPLSFGIGGGEIALDLDFDTGETPFSGKVNGEVRRVNLKRVLAPFEIADDSLGIIGGRLKLWIEGDSVADFLGSADGGLLLVMTQGEFDALLVELAGLDVQEALTTLIGDASTVPIACAYFDVPVNNGVATLKTALIDTADTLFLADGRINFEQETLDLVIEPQPKDVSLVSLRSAVHAQGPWTNLSFSPGGELAARGAALAALAAAAPLAALLPLLEPGAGEDSAYCGGLMENINKARKEN